MNPRTIPFWPFGINRTPAAPTPSEAARILSEEARIQKAKRTAMLDTLRGCVARGDVAKLGWRA